MRYRTGLRAAGRGAESALKGLDFDFSFTGFDPGDIDGFLGLHAGLTDPREVPHLVLCGDCTAPSAVSALLSPTSGQLPPALLVTDPPYGISLDSEWRDRAGLNGCGPAEASYMKRRTEGHPDHRLR